MIIGERYCVKRKIASGSMANVYLVYDEQLHKEWVMKVYDNPYYLENGYREVEILRQLNSRYFPKLVDVIKNEHTIYIILEYISGMTLAEWLMQFGYIDIKQAEEWLKQITKAVQYLHTLTPPITHGDIKPENIIVDQDKNLVLLDFNTAIIGNDSLKPIYATPNYAAPEQYQGEVSRQSDIYALGQTIIYALGKRDELPRKKFSYTTNLFTILHKCIAKEKQERYQNIDELTTVLEQLNMRASFLSSQSIKRLILLFGALSFLAASSYYGYVYSYQTKFQELLTRAEGQDKQATDELLENFSDNFLAYRTWFNYYQTKVFSLAEHQLFYQQFIANRSYLEKQSGFLDFVQDVNLFYLLHYKNERQKIDYATTYSVLRPLQQNITFQNPTLILAKQLSDFYEQTIEKQTIKLDKESIERIFPQIDDILAKLSNMPLEEYYLVHRLLIALFNDIKPALKTNIPKATVVGYLDKLMKNLTVSKTKEWDTVREQDLKRLKTVISAIDKIYQ